jgi:predicted DNA binding CopG/RHH family protein
MKKKIILDNFEQDIENNLESLSSVSNLKEEMLLIKKAAINHIKRKKSITLRISEMDLEAMKIKASRLGVPYQTYINILVHKDATSN